MANLQKNVASQNITFCMVTVAGVADASATVTVSITKDNGSQASGSGTTTNKGLGQYNYAPTQAETNAIDVGFMFTATGDVPVNLDFHTDPATDANGLLSVNLADILGTAVSTPATAGILDVNIKNVVGTAATAATAGILDVNSKRINNVATTSVTTINANLGSTQVLVFDTNNLLKVDVEDFGGTPGSFSSGLPGTITLVNNDKTGYTLTTAERQAVADALLNRNIAGGASGGARIVQMAFQALRNQVAIVTGVMTVYEDDNVTPAWEANITTTAGNPISEIAPTT